MAERGGSVQPNTSTKSDLGATSIPYRRRKDSALWWQHLIILLARGWVFVIVLVVWKHLSMTQKISNRLSNMEAKALHMEGELIVLRSRTNMLSGRLESLDKYFSDNEWLSKEEFNRVLDDYHNRKGGNVDLNEVTVLMRDIVTKEIEKHAADGLGRVDYALAVDGAYVMKHSKANDIANSVKMLTPSFGQPGECFSLEGNSGFVEIKLRKAIIPQAVTLEHVDKSVLENRSSAPKDCKVYGWSSREKITKDSKWYFLGNFTYDLEKSSAQSFDVSDSSRVVDIVAFYFSSNHGNPSYTCIYRFRVHGYEP